MAVTQSNSLHMWDRLIIDIKDHVYHYEIKDPKTWDKSRELLIDSIGCAILAINTSKECKAIVGPFVAGTSVEGGCRVPGTSHLLDPVKGAWDLGSLIRWLDFNDCMGGADWGHITDNLGSIIAVCDWLSQSSRPRPARAPPLTVRTVLEALIKAAEIQGTFNYINSFNKRGLDHTTLVKLASTAVVAWLMGLDEEQAMAAISHVFMDGCPLRVFRAGSNTIPRKAWAAGDACSRAVQLVLLTQNGQPGSKNVLTAPKWGFYENVWQGGQFMFPRPDAPDSPSPDFREYIIERTAYKLNPCEGHSLLAIEAMLEASKLLRARGLHPFRDVKTIRLRACRPIVLILDKSGELRNYADRDHCIQFVLGVTLLKGAPPITDDYQDHSPWASSTELTETRAKFDVLEDAGYSAEYYSHGRGEPSYPIASVVLELANGEVLEECVAKTCPGAPDHPKTPEGVRIKFRRNMTTNDAFTDAQIEKVINAVYDDNLPVSSLVDLLV